MKTRNLLLIIVVWLSVSTEAENRTLKGRNLVNDSMFLSETEWHYRETDLFSYRSAVWTYTIQDSLVGNVTYQYIYDIYEVFLRTEGAKVWCVVDSMGQAMERLLYDFDLQIGDSIRTIYLHDNFPESPHPYAKVTNVDTISLSDGRSARKISYDIRPDDIEYIGSINGILNPANLPIPLNGIKREFVCCTRENNLIYEVEKDACTKLLSQTDTTQMYAKQSTFIYFEDKNGLKDSLEIVVGLSDEQIEQLPSYTPAEAVQAFHDSTCWVVIGDRSSWEDRKYLRTYAYKPYNGMIEGERREIYFPADRIPVTISWDKQFFIDNELTHSVMSDMGSWFDASCSITEMDKVFLTANESWQLSATFEYDDGCSFDYLGGWGELLVRHFGIALGAANNPIESIEEIQTEAQCTKLLRDNQIFILRGGKVYTIQGQEVR